MKKWLTRLNLSNESAVRCWASAKSVMAAAFCAKAAATCVRPSAIRRLLSLLDASDEINSFMDSSKSLFVSTVTSSTNMLAISYFTIIKIYVYINIHTICIRMCLFFLYFLWSSANWSPLLSWASLFMKVNKKNINLHFGGIIPLIQPIKLVVFK